MRLDHCSRHLESFLELRPHRGEGFTALDLGTGWFPVIPIGLYLCGAGEQWTFDIAPLASTERVLQTLRRFSQMAAEGSLEKFLPRMRTERLGCLNASLSSSGHGTAKSLLDGLGIRLIVRDAQDTGLQSGSVDLFISTSVLHHLEVQALWRTMAEFRRLGTAEAVHSHYLHLEDQYAVFDRSITPFNFLRYSGRLWRYLDNPLTPANRLRISDYRALFVHYGYRITKEANTPGPAEDLEKIRLAPEFRSYSRDDLLVLRSWVVAKPA